MDVYKEYIHFKLIQRVKIAEKCGFLDFKKTADIKRLKFSQNMSQKRGKYKKLQ